MRIPEQFRQCAVFIAADMRDEGTGVVSRRPIGTGFYVGAPLEEEPGKALPYVVSARHVIEGASAAEAFYIRAVLKDGNVADFRTEPQHWTLHPTSDVALAPVVLGQELSLRWIGPDQIATDEWLARHQVAEGDDVFFVGLFVQHPGRERILPVVRFGTIALMPHEPVLVKTQGGGRALMDAFLAEARSWGGQSGSAVFIYEASIGRQPPIEFTALLGLVSAHFDIEESLEITGDLAELGSAKVPLNAGMAIVMPGQKIYDLLMAEERVEERAELAKRIRKNEPAAAADLAMPKDKTYQREDFMRDLEKATKPLKPERGKRSPKGS